MTTYICFLGEEPRPSFLRNHLYITSQQFLINSSLYLYSMQTAFNITKSKFIAKNSCVVLMCLFIDLRVVKKFHSLFKIKVFQLQ